MRYESWQEQTGGGFLKRQDWWRMRVTFAQHRMPQVFIKKKNMQSYDIINKQNACTQMCFLVGGQNKVQFYTNLYSLSIPVHNHAVPNPPEPHYQLSSYPSIECLQSTSLSGNSIHIQQQTHKLFPDTHIYVSVYQTTYTCI